MSDDWRLSALCAQIDADLWFPERDRNANWQSIKARKICTNCTVRAECLAEAGPDAPGIWGGLTVRQRRALAGRAPKEKY